MSDTDLIDLLKDIWEEDGMFNHLRAFYVEQRKNDLIDIQNIIKFGLNYHIFEIYECNSQNQRLTLNDFKKMQTDDALKIVVNQDSWKQDKVFYEVTFIDNKRWLNDLINLNRIPKIFINYKLYLK